MQLSVLILWWWETLDESLLGKTCIQLVIFNLTSIWCGCSA